MNKTELLARIKSTITDEPICPQSRDQIAITNFNELPESIIIPRGNSFISKIMSELDKLSRICTAVGIISFDYHYTLEHAKRGTPHIFRLYHKRGSNRGNLFITVTMARSGNPIQIEVAEDGMVITGKNATEIGKLGINLD